MKKTRTRISTRSPAVKTFLLGVVLSIVLSNVIPSSSFSVTLTKSSSGTFPSEEDYVLVQLGYLPSNYVGVSAWKVTNAQEKLPVAIQTYPLNGGAKRRQNKAKLPAVNEESSGKDSPSLSQQQQVVQSPFPTLFWLTCPDISRAVANLERRRFVQRFEDELNSKPDLARRLFRCHEEYARLRWMSLTEEDRNILTSSSSSSLQRMRNMMECSGISGTNFTDIASWDKEYAARLEEQETILSALGSPPILSKVPPIKCLHAHYAHYRSTRSDASTKYVNPVGELIHKQLEQDFPDLDL